MADIGPQLVTFDPVHAKADHHAVVQFGAAATDAKRQARDRLAVGAGEAAHGTLADALAQSVR